MNATNLTPNASLFNIWKRAWRAWRPYWKLALGVAAAQLLLQLFLTGFAYSLKLIIDNVTAGTNKPSLGLIIAALIVGFVLAAAATFLGEYSSARASALITNDIRRALFDKLQHLSLSYYLRTKLGDILTRFTGDLQVIEVGFTQGFINSFNTAVGLIINLPILFFLSWPLALVTLAAFPIIYIISRRLMPIGVAAISHLKQAEGEVLNTVQESARAPAVIQAFGLGEARLGRFQQQLNQLAAIIVKSRLSISTASKISSLSILLIQLSVTILGAALALRGSLSAGSLVAFLSIYGVVSKDIYEFSKKALPALIQASGGLARIDTLLENPAVVEDAAEAQPLPPFRQQIRFEDVAFSYTGEAKNLSSVNLFLGRGQTIALVGPSGSGKSTILTLLLRFYDPEQGRIIIDGRDIRSVPLSSLRQQMAAVFQDNFLFNTTLRENIRLSRPDAADSEVEEAAKAAEIHDLIMSLPDGYESFSGEAGGQLSGGQRQRISIARAILRDPAILILDEATSALDPGTEAAVNETIGHLGQGRTVISVTHRLHTATQADQIFVMKEGRVAEHGTHQELLAREGLYASLWQKQSGFIVSDDGRQAKVTPERLCQVRLFSELPLVELEYIAAEFLPIHFDARQVIFEEGEKGDCFYIIVRGQVEVLASDGAGDMKLIEILEDGDHFGEMSLLHEKPRNATIRTKTPTLLLNLYHDQLTRLIKTYPEIEPIIEKRMAQSLSNLAILRDS